MARWIFRFSYHKWRHTHTYGVGGHFDHLSLRRRQSRNSLTKRTRQLLAGKLVSIKRARRLTYRALGDDCCIKKPSGLGNRALGTMAESKPGQAYGSNSRAGRNIVPIVLLLQFLRCLSLLLRRRHFRTCGGGYCTFHLNHDFMTKP